MSKKMAILLVGCSLLSGMMSSAHAAKIQSTELSPSEAETFAQAQTDSAQTIDTATGGDVVGAFAIIGAVVVALIIIAAVN